MPLLRGETADMLKIIIFCFSIFEIRFSLLYFLQKNLLRKFNESNSLVKYPYYLKIIFFRT